MAILNFEDIISKTDERAWSYIEKPFPGAKDLLHETSIMLTLTHLNTFIRQNKKAKDGIAIYKYHIVFGDAKSYNKFATIYIKTSGENQVRVFKKDELFHKSEVFSFNTLDELRQCLIKGMEQV